MKIKINRGRPDFTIKGSFGSFDSLVEPHMLSKVDVNPNGNPITIHVMNTIQVSKGENEFSFRIEENIEIDGEGKDLNPQDILEVVVEAGKRCFWDAYDSSVRDSVTFPFVRTDPQMDTEKILSEIQRDLS